MVTTNLRAIAIEEVDLVACPKCLLKYSKVCGWTLRAEPGGSSEPDKFLPILKASLPDNLTQTLAVPWRKVCDDAWELHAQNKRGIHSYRQRNRGRMMQRDYFGSFRPWVPLHKHCFLAYNLFSRSFCQIKLLLFLLCPYSSYCLWQSSAFGFLLQHGTAKLHKPYQSNKMVKGLDFSTYRDILENQAY